MADFMEAVDALIVEKCAICDSLGAGSYVLARAGSVLDGVHLEIIFWLIDGFIAV